MRLGKIISLNTFKPSDDTSSRGHNDSILKSEDTTLEFLLQERIQDLDKKTIVK